MLMVDGAGTPISACTTAACTCEQHAIETLVDVRNVKQAPRHLLYDKAADADSARQFFEDWYEWAIRSRLAPVKNVPGCSVQVWTIF